MAAHPGALRVAATGRRTCLWRFRACGLEEAEQVAGHQGQRPGGPGVRVITEHPLDPADHFWWASILKWNAVVNNAEHGDVDLVVQDRRPCPGSYSSHCFEFGRASVVCDMGGAPLACAG